MCLGKNFLVWLSSCSEPSVNVLSASGTKQWPRDSGLPLQKSSEQFGKSSVELWHFPSQWTTLATQKEFLLPGRCCSPECALLCIRWVQTCWNKSGWPWSNKEGSQQSEDRSSHAEEEVQGFRKDREEYLSCKVIPLRNADRQSFQVCCCGDDILHEAAEKVSPQHTRRGTGYELCWVGLCRDKELTVSPFFSLLLLRAGVYPCFFVCPSHFTEQVCLHKGLGTQQHAGISNTLMFGEGFMWTSSARTYSSFTVFLVFQLHFRSTEIHPREILGRSC